MIRKTAFGPASVANVAVGFDLLGFAVHDLGDLVTVSRSKDRGIRVTKIEVADGVATEVAALLPKDAKSNTATAGLLKLQDDLDLQFGFELEIKKGIPLGSGLGGSAASAVAAVVAANALLDKPLSREDLLPYAVEGEAVASGSRHADNVAPSLFGGLVLVSDSADNSVALPIPDRLSVVVVHPGFRVDTKDAREVLPKQVPFKSHVQSNSRLAGFLAGCFLNKPELIKANLRDAVVEPARAHLIPGFSDVQAAAMSAGAWGASIAGAGPSMFAWCDRENAKSVMEGMLAAARNAGHKNSRGWHGRINSDGAKLID